MFRHYASNVHLERTFLVCSKGAFIRVGFDSILSYLRLNRLIRLIVSPVSLMFDVGIRGKGDLSRLIPGFKGLIEKNEESEESALVSLFLFSFSVFGNRMEERLRKKICNAKLEEISNKRWRESQTRHVHIPWKTLKTVVPKGRIGNHPRKLHLQSPL